jgi:hypothetical protein
MSDVRREQIDDSKQSQIEAASGLGARSQNKSILEDVSFKAKRGTSLAYHSMKSFNLGSVPTSTLIHHLSLATSKFTFVA